MITLIMQQSGSLAQPFCVYFMHKGVAYSVEVLGNWTIKYEFLRDLPEYAIVDLLKFEFRWNTPSLRALVEELQLGSLDWAVAHALVVGDVHKWKFSTLDDVKSIIAVAKEALHLGLNPEQRKSFIRDQTGLDL